VKPTTAGLPTGLYRPSLALLTDLYQLTMAQGYWKSGRAEREAVFQLAFRHHPFEGGFTIAAGLAYLIDYISHARFEADDLAYLAGLRGATGQPLFEPPFLDYLAGLDFRCDVDAVVEGEIVFPHEPLLRVTGPIVQAQLLETPALALVNFQTLIATKAARICLAARGDSVLEFGLRRAQGIDGALAASRAAYLGGCAATSHLLAGRLFGIPVGGTHAHSWVMSFDHELEAFEEYARVMPNNCVFLVDTYDTLSGVRHAIEVGRRLRAHGHELLGVRLDSGDLADLSRRARGMLDEAGFPNAIITASGDLDEHLIAKLKAEGATISLWGVGTRLVTAYDQPALGGVYKLAAIREGDGSWRPCVKLSEQLVKRSLPGRLQVRRFERGGEAIGDLLYDVGLGAESEARLIDPRTGAERARLTADAEARELLVPVFRHGKLVYQPPPLAVSREYAAAGLRRFPASVKRLANPDEYLVGLEPRLHQLQTDLVLDARRAIQ
jgi:nicotinate phosphoribosyltransferase